MPDFDLGKETKNGFSFRRIIVQLITYSASLFLGLSWSSWFSEAVNTYIPHGQGIFQKALLNTIVTLVLAIVIYFLTRKRQL